MHVSWSSNPAVTAILRKLNGVRRSGQQWVAKCPAHHDRKQSLSVGEDGGTVLLYCHKGCTLDAVLAKIGVEKSKLFSTKESKLKEISTFDYTDESGELLYQVVRYEPKTFRVRRPNGKNGWIWNLGSTRRVLYRLPFLVDANEVLVTEGEKDAVTARRLGHVATCNSGGAGKWRPEYSEALRGKNIVIVPDNDEVGRKHASQIRDSLVLVAASVKIVELPGAKDLSEWVAAGHRSTELRTLIDATPIYRSGSVEGALVSSIESFSTAQLYAANDLKIEWLAWPILGVGLSSIVDALPKLGKTRFFLEAIKASRDGRPFLGQSTKPMRVIYVSEQSAASLAMQCQEVGFTGAEPVDELRWITREHWSRFLFSDLIDAIEKEFLRGGNYNALIVDTWHTVARLNDENAAPEVNRLGNRTLDVAARHKMALSMSRHDRKSGGDVGLSGRSSIQLTGLVDVVAHLLRMSGKIRPGVNLRRMQTVGRVPGLPTEQIIELRSGSYVSLGLHGDASPRIEVVREFLRERPDASGPDIVAHLKEKGFTVDVSTAKRDRDQVRMTADVSV